MSTASTSRSLEQLFHERIVLLDGAMGSLIQSYPLAEKDFAASASRSIRMI